MNIQQKLIEVRKSIKGFSKDTKAFNFNYVSGNQILRAIKDKMDELGILLIPEVDYDTLTWCKHEYVNSKDQPKLDFIVQAKMTYKWINADAPEEVITVPWLMVGQQGDDISKAIGTGLTYNERYFLLKQFGLPTDEDDADNKEPIEYAPRGNNNKNGLISDAQAKRLYAIGKGKDNAAIKDILKKYNFAKSNEVTKDKYDIICKEIEAL